MAVAKNLFTSLFSTPETPKPAAPAKPPPAFNTTSVSEAGASLRARRRGMGRASTILTPLGGGEQRPSASTSLLGA